MFLWSRKGRDQNKHIIMSKLNVNKEGEKLKMYVYTIQSGHQPVEFPEDVRPLLAYNDTHAVNILKSVYPKDIPITIKKRVEIDIDRILNSVVLPGSEVGTLIPAVPEKEKTVQEFVYGMYLVADKFVEDPEDRQVVKDIIRKIKLEP